MHMPIVSRFRTYGIIEREHALSAAATAYCDAIWRRESVQELCAIAQSTGSIPQYDR